MQNYTNLNRIIIAVAGAVCTWAGYAKTIKMHSRWANGNWNSVENE